MSVRDRLRSRLLNAYISEPARRLQRSSSELKRRVTGSAHVVSAFLQLDDPYSYLLARYLPALADHYDIELRVYLSEALGGDYRPMPEMLAEHAVTDCKRLAAELGVPFLDKRATPPVEYRRALLDELAVRATEDDFADDVLEVLEIYWRGDVEAASHRASAATGGGADTVIEAAQKRLDDLGHYDSAMLHYGGEWYWGVDRLQHLMTRLDELDVAREDGSNAQLAAIQQAMRVDLPIRPPAAAQGLPALELFYSFRSPYSQLCLDRVYELVDAFGLELVIRPVLPMVMRGLPVPPRKIRYIVRDAMREAEVHGVSFGKIEDPVGDAVERCHAVFHYARQEKREREFVLDAARQIWGNAVDAATDDGLRRITAKTGLFWPEVKLALEDDGWRESEAEDRQLMLSLGSWGVPTMCIGDYVVWGQDRIWLLARHLEDLCDTGEGILV